jgi:hypothetical protein
VRLCEHTMRVGDRTPKTGTFYLAGNRNFLFGSDTRDGEKVRTVLPADVLRIHQAQVGFVHQRRGLQGVAVALATHLALRHAVQIAIDERRKALHRALIAGAPGLQ